MMHIETLCVQPTTKAGIPFANDQALDFSTSAPDFSIFHDSHHGLASFGGAFKLPGR